MPHQTLEEQLAVLKAEISNLDRAFAAQMHELGLALDDLVSETLPDDEYSRKMIDIAQEAATRAGKERVAQYTGKVAKPAFLPGAGRKGAVRL